MPSKIDPGMRAHSGGSPKGVVVGRDRVGKKYVYDVQWDPLPVLWSGSSWMSDDDTTDPEEDTAVIDRGVPGARLRAAR